MVHGVAGFFLIIQKNSKDSIAVLEKINSGTGFYWSILIVIELLCKRPDRIRTSYRFYFNAEKSVKGKYIQQKVNFIF